jgi:hypothetical protein
LSQARFLARRLRGQLRVWVFDDDRRAVVKGESLTIDEVVRPHMRQSRFRDLARYRRGVFVATIGACRKENSPKGVDDVSVVLHNLVSLLQMQRRRTKRCRVVEVGVVTVVNAQSIFKN